MLEIALYCGFMSIFYLYLPRRIHRFKLYSYCLRALQIEQSPDNSLAIILTPIVKIQSVRSLCRTASLTLVGSLTLAAVSTVSQSEKAAAIDLNFGSPTTANNLNSGFAGLNLGPGNNRATIDYLGVAAGIDARVTAVASGNGTFAGHLPNYSTATTGEPAGDAGFVYVAASGGTGGAGTGVAGGLSYTFDFFNSGSNFGTRATAQGLDLRFLVYDVDGEPSQGEAVRIAKGNGTSGLISYQRGNGGTSLAGNTVGPLTVSEDLNNYTFTGQNDNIAETNSAAATVFNFANTNSVTFNFEAFTRSGSNANNPVFSAIDGDLSLLGATETAKQASLRTNFGPLVTANAAGTITPVPEPFTIIGTLVGGTAALRMRKKLKASSGV
jgi:hypothetical protein